MKLLEVIVIIDGGTDRSSEIAHLYEEKYPETFRVIDKENGNYGSCVNRGLKEANGKYIKVLDADDWFDTKVFETYLNKLQQVDVDLVLNDMVQINENNEVLFKCELASSFNNCHDLCFSEFFKHTTPRYIGMHCLAYRTAMVRTINYQQTEGISYTDVEWIFEPMLYVKTFYAFNNPLYFYLLGRDGQTMDPKVLKKKKRETETMLRSLINRKEICWNNIDEIHQDYALSLLNWHIYHYCLNADRENILSFLNKIKEKYAYTYNEMFSWCSPFNNNVNYVRLISKPWITVLSKLFKGYRPFVDSMDFAYTAKIIRPLWIANIFYVLKNSIRR